MEKMSHGRTTKRYIVVRLEGVPTRLNRSVDSSRQAYACTQKNTYLYSNIYVLVLRKKNCA